MFAQIGLPNPIPCGPIIIVLTYIKPDINGFYYQKNTLTRISNYLKDIKIIYATKLARLPSLIDDKNKELVHTLSHLRTKLLNMKLNFIEMRVFIQ